MMKTKTLLISCMTALVALFAITSVFAGTLNVSITDVVVDDVVGGVVGSPGSTLPVEVRFTSNEDLNDVKLKVWVSGYREDIEASTDRFHLVAGKQYVKRLSITLPAVYDLDDLDEDLTLHVQLADKDDEVEDTYTITVDRDSYDYSLLSVEAPSLANAGDVIAIDVVLKNIGREELEDSFVIARIPELGVYKKVYFGDIAPEDNWQSDDDAEDARERRIYLVIPADAESGDYDLRVRASNYDASEEVVKSITIDGASTSEGTTGRVIITSSDNEGVPNSIIVLTVILVIVFLVLLIVLVVLLTKRPAEKAEDYSETSYY